LKIRILSIGKWKTGPESALFEKYRARLGWPLILQEIEEKRAPLQGVQKTREGALLLAALGSKEGGKGLGKDGRPGFVIALDEKGKSLDSRDIAALFGKLQDRGIGAIAILIGGADGLDSAVLESADLTLSLGAPTWPHLLVRALIAEQVYRAQQILAGHPYHRD